ncbi:MAG: PspC domain-containing protein [Clostridium sp.]|uniref:PspC domain-containing protein n=1 Tax=Clostridium sp. TaxID=1506 RepID=UPI003065180F
MNNKLCKSNNAAIAGVCGGVAEYFGFDVKVLRIIWVVSTIFAGAGFWIYVALWILMSDNNF